MTHAIIIRFHYEETDPRWPWRFQYFKNVVLPRLLSQTNQDFDICIRCNQWQIPHFMELSPRIIPFYVKNERVNYRTAGAGRKKIYFFDFANWDEVVGLKKYDIQSGLDSDDLISVDYIQTVKDKVREYASAHPGKALHLCFQPEIFNTKSNLTYSIGIKYSEKDGSAFMSLYQPDKENYHWVYEISHHKLGQLADKSIVLPAGYCWASVHDHNESTGKSS